MQGTQGFSMPHYICFLFVQSWAAGLVQQIMKLGISLAVYLYIIMSFLKPYLQSVQLEYPNNPRKNVPLNSVELTSQETYFATNC